MPPIARALFPHAKKPAVPRPGWSWHERPYLRPRRNGSASRRLCSDSRQAPHRVQGAFCWTRHLPVMPSMLRTGRVQADSRSWEYLRGSRLSAWWSGRDSQSGISEGPHYGPVRSSRYSRPSESVRLPLNRVRPGSPTARISRIHSNLVLDREFIATVIRRPTPAQRYFERTIVRQQPRVSVSRCISCHKSVGAASNKQTLTMVESVHIATVHPSNARSGDPIQRAA